LQNFDFLGMVIFRFKKTCEVSTENYVLCSFELEKDPIFRICAIRMDSRKKYDLCPSTTYIKFEDPFSLIPHILKIAQAWYNGFQSTSCGFLNEFHVVFYWLWKWNWWKLINLLTKFISSVKSSWGCWALLMWDMEMDWSYWAL
jgi:hypothetical protein